MPILSAFRNGVIIGQLTCAYCKYRESREPNENDNQTIKTGKSQEMNGMEGLRLMATKTYYKVIVLKIDAFESEIVDERHFPNVTEAMTFCDNISNSTNYTTFTVRM